jgi:hypothetical protein
MDSFKSFRLAAETAVWSNEGDSDGKAGGKIAATVDWSNNEPDP